jgi:hypothetical protein
MEAGCMDFQVFALQKPKAQKWHGCTSRLIGLKSIFKNFTTKAEWPGEKAHEGRQNRRNMVLRVPLCALVVYILLFPPFLLSGRLV